MEIRRARVEDAQAISRIAESVRFNPESADPKRGYLVFVGKPEEYAARLAGNECSYVAVENGEVVAFLLAMPTAENAATHVVSDGAEALLFGGGAVLVDQIGVDLNSRGKGVGAAMYSRLLEEHHPARMTASVMHGPVKNLRSAGFFSGRCGWKCIGEYTEGFGLMWGIYEWKEDGTQGDFRYPLGKFLYTVPANEVDLAARVERIRVLPERLRKVLSKMDEDRLDVPTRPGAWTSRQLVHHMADAHGQLTARCRWILTEEQPPVKTFEENLWAELADAKTAPTEESVRLLEGLHARVARLISSRPHSDLQREMFHSEQGLVKLDRVLAYLDWHGRHHTAQIAELAT